MSTFDGVSGQYAGRALVQKKASEKLLHLLSIGGKDAVLDVGCGPGHITAEIRRLTRGRVVGTDVSAAMIGQASKTYPDMEFREVASEDLDYSGEFDVVFCNSTFQWFAKPEVSLRSMAAALRVGGRIGIACPATEVFSPFFDGVVTKAAARPGLKEVFARWRSPWFFLADEAGYRRLFEKPGFWTHHLSIDRESQAYPVAEAYGVWLSGAAQGYVGNENYDGGVDETFIAAFNAAVKEEMEKIAVNGTVEVTFNRLYYVGEKVASMCGGL